MRYLLFIAVLFLSAPALAQTHASDGRPYCSPMVSDQDEDGADTEIGQRCYVRNGPLDPDRPSDNFCHIREWAVPYCASDNGNWQVVNGDLCISASFCYHNRPAQKLPTRTDLVTPNAAPVAEKLYDYLRSMRGVAIVSGVQDHSGRDDLDMIQRVFNETGKRPAIQGFDLINEYDAFPVNGFEQVEEAIAWHQSGGIVYMSWHHKVPYGTGSNTAFYTTDTGVVLPMKDNQLDTTHPMYATIVAGIDKVAVDLKRLEDAGMAVLWRPYHEAAGGWFWWGAKRNDGENRIWGNILLWRLMFDRLVNHHGIKNLIWVWNGEQPGWWPGDEYVDIISWDYYLGQWDARGKKSHYDYHRQASFEDKLTGISEMSNMPDPGQALLDGAHWSFMVHWWDWRDADERYWNNFYAGTWYNTVAHKVWAYNHPRVITKERLPKLTVE